MRILLFLVYLSHQTLFTAETLPLWTFLRLYYDVAHATSPSLTAIWSSYYLYGTTLPLLVRLMEGGWMAILRWFLALATTTFLANFDRCFWTYHQVLWSFDVHLWIGFNVVPLILVPLFRLLLYGSPRTPFRQPRLHQPTQHDVRFWYPTSIELQMPTAVRYTHTPWYRTPRRTSPFQHSQYAIRLRVRYRFVSLRCGFRFKPLLTYVPIRTTLRRLRQAYENIQKKKKTPPPPRLATLDDLVHFDGTYYDRVAAKLEAPLYLYQRDSTTTTRFDHSLYDEQIVRRTTPTVEPTTVDYFDESLYERQEPRFAFERVPSTQEMLSPECQYGVSTYEDWAIFDEVIHPYDWIIQYKDLMNPSHLTGTKNDPVRAIQEAKRHAVELQTNRIPHLALIARTTCPHESEMQGTFLSNAFKSAQASPSDRTPIVLDTGASISCTPFASDFVTELETVNDELTGLNETIEVQGAGLIEWSIRDYFGRISVVRTRAYLVPSAHVRLFSPQTYFKENQSDPATKGRCEFDHQQIRLCTVDGNELVFPFDCGNNLPYMLTSDSVMFAGTSMSQIFNLQTTPMYDDARNLLLDQNYNLTRAQKELMLNHQRYGHAGFGWLQDLMRVTKTNVGDPADPPFLPTREKGTSSCAHPKCASCLLARQQRKGAGSSLTVNKPELEMAIRRDDLEPGDQVSTDQYVCGKPGRLPHTKGKERPSEQYHGGTIFYDHASSFIWISHQVTLSAAATVMSKHDFERFARSHGVTVKSYRADNHPYSLTTFLDDIEMLDQEITFSGVGAHHQNGASERTLQTICTWARALMMNQLLHWPDQYNTNLWPFALEHAVYIWNNLPKGRNGLTPLELFTKLKQPKSGGLLRVRVWGSPAFVLDPALQDNKRLPKWTKRSRCGMYLGQSHDHHSTVGKILNLQTGHVSPQFHVVYDELFTTSFGTLQDSAFDADHWAELLRLGSEHAATIDQEHRPLVPEKSAAQDRVANDLFQSFLDPDHVTPPPPPLPPVPEGDDQFWPDTKDETQSDGTSVTEGASSSEGDSSPEGADPNEGLTREVRFVDELDRDQPPRRRSSRRTRNPRPRYKQSARTVATCLNYTSNLLDQGRPRWKRQQYLAGGSEQRKLKDSKLEAARLHSLNWNPSTLLSSAATGTSRSILHEALQRYEFGDWHPMALQAKKNADPDLPGWEEAMNGPCAEGYKEAAKLEVDTLKKMHVWDEVDREPWMSVLPSTWAFRRKTFPDGSTKKFKGRFCVRGDREVAGVHFDPDRIYAPVVSWTTVRLLLLLAAQLDLATRQVDYVAAFVHSPLPKPAGFDKMSPEEQRRSGTYVEMPRGFKKDGKVLRLNKALYGLRSAPRAFFSHLKSNLEAIGFRQATNVDPCLFISDKVICVCYVDDTCLYAAKSEDIDEVIRQLTEERRMALEVEDDVAGFLGVEIKKNQDTGQITLKQVGLKKKIIEALKIDDLPAVYTPADCVLGKDEDGEGPHCDFNYASVIGMCFYLYSHSTPEIGFAISQLSRFTFNPKRSHELALIRLGQYLKGTLNEAMVIEPMKLDEFRMDVYVDSDFLGLYGKERRDDPDNVRCRAGYVIMLNDCPVVWKSCLLDSICTSTMMAEYYSLSLAMREVLPLRNLVCEVANALKINDMCTSTFMCTAHEDNAACETLANLEPGRVTPRSKFYDVKVHWFRSMLSDKIVVQRVDTKMQIADIYTKPLPREDFERLRKMLSGW